MLSPFSYRRIIKFCHYASVLLLTLAPISTVFIAFAVISFMTQLYCQDCYEQLCLQRMTAEQEQAYDFEQLSKQNGYFLDKQPILLTHFGEYQLVSIQSRLPNDNKRAKQTDKRSHTALV